MIDLKYDEGKAKTRAFLRFAIYLEENGEHELLDKMLEILDEERTRAKNVKNYY